ncbi:MAG: hypothetical protein AMXMBFR47_05890 [Planctomycetota bacterium]
MKTSCICAILAAAALHSTAAGQSNAFNRVNGGSRQGVATSQPVGRNADQVLLGSGTVKRPARAADADAPPPPNPLLLKTSLIAVEVKPPRKIRVNDLVTVIIREDKRSQTDSKLETEKKWDIETQLDAWIRLNEEHKLVPQNFTNGVPNIGFKMDNQYDGNGKTERKDSLTTRITATVIDVKPNGLLVLEDTKTIRTDEDVQIIRLTGICRSEDVTPENTVLSTQLAKASIETEHTGPARDASRRGWLMRTFDFLRPF